MSDGYLDWIYLSSIIIVGALLVVIVYELLMLSDLESDLLNNIDFCRRLNKFLFPEIYVHMAHVLLLLLSWKWLMFLLNLPIAAYNGYKIYKHRVRLDATKIMMKMSGFGNELLVKLAFFMVMFFVYLFLLLYYLMGSD
eukprot:Phypoly_transcript_26018.p1 GENE.Phypoly_transcript_26018~~Phypoly_transcript_26018.p1  ORF type:complete len:139 (+),score=8.74 Phypoly_transcript_26018:80-496(+)